MRLRQRPRLRALLVVAVAAAAVFAVLRVEAEPATRTTRLGPSTWRGLVGGAHPAVATAQRQIVVLHAPSVADRLAQVRYATEEDERRWAAQAYAVQEQVLTRLASRGLGVRPDYSFARVINGFSATLDPRALAVLQAIPEVAGVYPVRAAFPAALSAQAVAPDAVFAATVELPGFEGEGQTIALLDTGVDRTQPYVQGRVEPGIDIVDATETADARANPQDAGDVERHGTELAGLLVGQGGPGGLRGVAPEATVLPIRIAGWQPDV